MKRIQSDCLAQTVLFETREDLEKYIAGLQKKHVKYRIENESAKGNGSVLIKIKRSTTITPAKTIWRSAVGCRG